MGAQIVTRYVQVHPPFSQVRISVFISNMSLVSFGSFDVWSKDKIGVGQIEQYPAVMYCGDGVGPSDRRKPQPSDAQVLPPASRLSSSPKASPGLDLDAHWF